MAVKLIKACKELNVGIYTIVSFCNEKGIYISSNPNTRIDDSKYLLLARKFNPNVAKRLEEEGVQVEEVADKIEHIYWEESSSKRTIITQEPEMPDGLLNALENRAEEQTYRQGGFVCDVCKKLRCGKTIFDRSNGNWHVCYKCLKRAKSIIEPRRGNKKVFINTPM
jgi:hypothetical protein